MVFGTRIQPFFNVQLLFLPFLDCKLPLGVHADTATIPDEQITYSYFLLGPGAGRLDGVEWQTNEWYPWLQVDFGSLLAVSGVQIQPCSSSFVTSARIKYGETNNTLSYFMDDDGDPKVSTIYSKKLK